MNYTRTAIITLYSQGNEELSDVVRRGEEALTLINCAHIVNQEITGGPKAWVVVLEGTD